MIVRLLSSVLLAWVLGFAWFALLLPQPLGDQKTAAVVVPTGGPLRIDRGLEALRNEWAERMLISGVDRDVRPAELSAQYPGATELFDCCVDLGFRAYDTRSNGIETARWAKQREITSVRLVTTDWHMRRAEYELKRALPGTIAIYTDAVASKPSLMTLWREYNKLVVRWRAGRFGV